MNPIRWNIPSFLVLLLFSFSSFGSQDPIDYKPQVKGICSLRFTNGFEVAVNFNKAKWIGSTGRYFEAELFVDDSWDGGNQCVGLNFQTQTVEGCTQVQSPSFMALFKLTKDGRILPIKKRAQTYDDIVADQESTLGERLLYRMLGAIADQRIFNFKMKIEPDGIHATRGTRSRLMMCDSH